MSPLFNRRHIVRALGLVLTAASFSGAALAHHDNDDQDREGERGGLRSGKLFISSNSPAGNEVLVYARAANGPAVLVSRTATHGVGTGAGLGSQGAVTLSRDGQHLFVVNAASNTVSTFAVRTAGLVLTSVVDSGGLTPTSVTEQGGLVYVLNAGGSGGVVGYRNQRGVLTPISGAAGSLSASGGTAPAQVSFNDDGDVLVVTERNTQKITSFAVRKDGRLDGKTVTASAGAVPFGFAFARNDTLVVSEAVGSAASSYRIHERTAAPVVVTPSLANGQGAACWVAVSPDGKVAFTANAATSNVSSYAVARNGQLSLLASAAGSTGAGAGALDMAVAPSGRQLAVFANRALQIVSFTIGANGTLVPLGGVGGMPAGSAGLAAN